nr:ParB/RepB/Spo0J family partition protein [uncultured Porphyromonas sp.]
MAMKTKSVLGRGLGNLLSDEPMASLSGAASIQELSISLIQPNPNQPRREFDEERLEELASSIRALGLVQPITVQELGGGQYQIISGERRWRAAQRAGLERLPAYIRPVRAEELMELALVENIQREDLNAIEIALAYQQIIDLQQLKQEELAERVGKKRTTVANYLRLLRLPAEIQLGLTQRLIDMGHARALLQIEDTERQLELYALIQQEQLSVRAVEELARAVQQGGEELPTTKPSSSPKPSARADYKILEQHLAQVFASRVTLRCNAQGKGRLTIPFSSDEELERIMQLLERVQH